MICDASTVAIIYMQSCKNVYHALKFWYGRLVQCWASIKRHVVVTGSSQYTEIRVSYMFYLHKSILFTNHIYIYQIKVFGFWNSERGQFFDVVGSVLGSLGITHHKQCLYGHCLCLVCTQLFNHVPGVGGGGFQHQKLNEFNTVINILITKLTDQWTVYGIKLY